MNNRYITPFYDASKEILNQVLLKDIIVGDKNEIGSSFNTDNVVIIVGVVGNIKGQVVFSMNEKDSCFIASTMMGGMPVLQLDNISKSAISELANMICGNAATKFSLNDITVDIAPPSIMVGKDIEVLANKSSGIHVPIQIDNHKLNLNIFLE